MGGPPGADALAGIWQFIRSLGGGGGGGAGMPTPPPGALGSSVAAGVTPTPAGAPGAFPSPQPGPAPQQGQAPPPPQPGQGTTGAAPPQDSGIPPVPPSSALDSPALQALLAGYFNFIRSPRSQGLGGALGSAGAGALGQYASARQAQYIPQMLAAQLGVQHSEVTKNLAAAKVDQMKAGEPERNLLANGDTATQLQAYAATLQNKNEAAMLTTFANSIKNDPTKSWGYGEALKAFDEQARAQEEIQRGKLFEFEGPGPGTLGSARADEASAAAAASRAAAGVSQQQQKKIAGEVAQQPVDLAKKTADVFRTQADTLQAQANAAKTDAERADIYGKMWDLDHSAAADVKGTITRGLTRQQYIDQQMGPKRGRGVDPKLAPQIISRVQALDPKAHGVQHPDGSIGIIVNGVEAPLSQFIEEGGTR